MLLTFMSLNSTDKISYEHVLPTSSNAVKDYTVIAIVKLPIAAPG